MNPAPITDDDSAWVYWLIPGRKAAAGELANPTGAGTIEVHCLPQSVMYGLAVEAGCMPLEVREDTAMGPPSHWPSNTFVFVKPG